MKRFDLKCGHLEEKVNTSPLQQNQQLKDWMLKEVMLSFTMRVRLEEIFFLDGTPLQFIVVLAPFEKICFMMESSQPFLSMQENGAKSRITRFPEPSHTRQASKRSWKISSLSQDKNKENFTSKELAQESNNFWNTDWSSSGLSRNWKNLLQKYLFHKKENLLVHFNQFHLLFCEFPSAVVDPFS